MANETPYATPISTTNGNLCKACENLFKGSYSRHQTNSDLRSFKSVQDSRGSCKFCDLIYRKVPRNPDLSDQQQLHYRLEVNAQIGMPRLVATCSPDDTSQRSRGYQFIFIPPSYVQAGKFFPGRLDSAKKSGRAQELVNKWMDVCTGTHANCGNFAEGGFYTVDFSGEVLFGPYRCCLVRSARKYCCLVITPFADRNWRPTRLLDIGEGPDFNSLRLCEGDEITPGVIYMTLSHCWGGTQPTKLTQETYPHFRNSIAFNSLPTTFRNALEVVRRLGKRYIWIDSICILQDSIEDWNKEADMMCSVYRNSFCNLGATGASVPTEGLFKENTDEVFRIWANWKETRAESVWTEFYYFDQQEWDRTFQTAPLHKRAWVLQERLLAPRMLHFGLSQVAWECNQLHATERFPLDTSGFRPLNFIAKRLNLLHGAKEAKVRLGSDILQHISSQLGNSPLELSQMNDLRETWNGIIAAYSETRLTVDSDRIPAFTGIVDKYKELTSDDFLAGLWRSTIEWNLVWRAKEPRQRYDYYVAPSWSWLSLKDTPVRGGSEWAMFEVKLGHVLQAEVTPSPGRSKYTVMDGHIRCWGRVALATWSSNGPGDSKGELLFRSDSNTTKPLHAHFHADTPEAMNATELLLFPIFLYPPVSLEDKVMILALEQNKEDPEATYRRIGMIEARGSKTYTLGAACEYLMSRLHSNSNERGLEPTLHDDISVLAGDGSGYLKNQHSVKGVSFTVK